MHATSPRRSRIDRGAALAAAGAVLAGVLAGIPAAPAAANGCPSPTTSVTYSGGDGSAGDPFRIATTADLLRLSSTPGDWGSYFLQTADISLTGCTTWNEIGNGGTQFTGSYSAAKPAPATGSWAVSGFPANPALDTDPYGMFGVVDGATISDLTIGGGMTSLGTGALGAVVGEARGASTPTVLRDVAVIGDVVGTAAAAVGGLVGTGPRDASLQLRSVSVTGDVTGKDTVGGAYGGGPRVDLALDDVTVVGDVEGFSSEIGGLVGRTTGDLAISDSTFTGSVTATRDDSRNYAIGGIAGYAFGRVEMIDVVVDGGSITARGAEIGGAVGYASSNVATEILLTGVVIRNPVVVAATSAAATVGCLVGDPGDTAPNVTLVRSTALSTSVAGTVTDCGGGGGGDEERSRPVLTATGVPPSLPPGTGLLQGVDGSETPLTGSSPAPGQVRYETDGLVLTLTGTTGSGSGLVADRDGDVECLLCAFLAAGGVIESWVFSEPRLVAAHRVEDLEEVLRGLPCQRFTIPVGAPLDGGDPLPPGVHTLQLQLPTTTGIQVVNVGVTVTGPVPGSIPAGEGRLTGDADRAVPAVIALLLGTAVMAGTLRRRRIAAVG